MPPSDGSSSTTSPYKRLILCEDGTWLNSDSASLHSSLNIASNITRLSRAIKSESADGIPQITYYHFGVGSAGSLVDRLRGATGSGIAEIVREGYAFLGTNYEEGDEIFIFGFSRGALTARAIAGLIGDVGLLTKKGLPYLPEVFRDAQHQHDDRYRARYPDLPFPGKPSVRDPGYRDELRRRGMTRLKVQIKVVGVFDTVGALGVPKIGILQRLGLQSSAMKDLTFYDTRLSACVENAFQALALDERRFAFQPTLWERGDGNTVLRQVWFPGAHSNIGGGYDDQQIATITLAWMIAQCLPFLAFDLNYVLDEWDAVDEFYEEKGERPRPWGFGKILDGLSGIYYGGGVAVRTPGRYCATDPHNGKPTDDPLEDTHEYIHPVVRARIKLKGPGIDDHGAYECKALRNWKLTIDDPEDGRQGVFWRSKPKQKGFTDILPEAPLKPLERELLAYDQDTCEYILRPRASRQRRRKRDRRTD
ncbi:hypothetical protein K470DRAFT_218202 [Piedraia hortae CBS 480.64]|uniref:T6SS Phospholipase effector Tle1-like catalytic domain-containing protein n=1 Tax=Piedraia hortae CBS 480.64 TaxID=1314780 RepID=A0A6A7BWZ2_9PEZI|nr:hypothetical protein K470DRAFT_218202 [Piedraia hortae CBS 480.64]